MCESFLVSFLKWFVFLRIRLNFRDCLDLRKNLGSLGKRMLNFENTYLLKDLKSNFFFLFSDIIRHPCDRVCDTEQPPMHCKYSFDVELLNTLNKVYFFQHFIILSYFSKNYNFRLVSIAHLIRQIAFYHIACLQMDLKEA